VTTAKPWTPDELGRLAALYRAGLPVKTIARRLGRPIHAARYRVSRLGLCCRSKPLLPWFREAVGRLHAEGMYDRQMARELDCHPESVRRARWRLGLAANPAPRGVLTAAQVARARRLRAAGRTHKEIAGRVGTNATTVCLLLAGKIKAYAGGSDR
jgi:hypothetical protein